MSWNYRLIRLNGKFLPRLAEVYYDTKGKPEFYSEESFAKNLYWAVVVPLKDIFRRSPLREEDFGQKEEE